MPTQEELKDELIKALKRRPRIESFFGSMLQERTKRSRWLENGLVQLFLQNAEANLEIIEDFLKNAKDPECKLFQQLAKELKGTEPDFDSKIDDLLSELNALSWMIKNGYTEITKIPRTKRKTPDFQAVKEGTCLFEVKNLQDPDELHVLVFLYLRIQAQLNPDLFSVFCKVSVSNPELSGDIINDTDKLNVHRLVSQVEDALKSTKDKVEFKYKKIVGDRKIAKTIKCTWNADKSFSIMGNSRYSVTCLSDPKRPMKLIPLIRKTWDHTSRAVEQLMEHDQDDSHQKWILINWQKPMDFLLDDALSDKFRDSILEMDNILKVINPNLHIHLL